MLAVAKSNARLEAMKARILFNSRHKNDESVIAKIDFEIKNQELFIIYFHVSSLKDSFFLFYS